MTGPADDRAPDGPVADGGPRNGGASLEGPRETPHEGPRETPHEGPHETPREGPHETPREGPRERRPWIERIGLAGIAIVLGGLFGFVAVAAWSGGELFLAVMGGIGCLMTLWVGGLTLVRG